MKLLQEKRGKKRRSERKVGKKGTNRTKSVCDWGRRGPVKRIKRQKKKANREHDGKTAPGPG